ncbi:MAG: APC family permease [bacterium]
MDIKKQFKLIDAILAAVCITLVAEAVVPTASIGNSQYFWWIFLILSFCIPYGLVASELGSTYPSEGGLYTWVKNAYGIKWASRVAWNYWVNFPIWIASLAILFTDIIMGIFDIELSILWLIIIQLSYTWIVTFLGCFRIGESKWLVNIGTFCKIVIMLSLGILGIYTFIKTGESANPINSYKDLLPSFDFHSLSFISVIIFNFLGLEIVATFAEDMKNPEKEIPKAIMIGSLLLAIFYLLPATGVNIAMDLDTAATATIPEAFGILLEKVGASLVVINSIVIIIGIMFIFTLFANIASWSFGVTSVAKFSADDKGLPSFLTKVNNSGVPYVAAISNGVIASIVLLAGIFITYISEDASNLFWTFFSLSLISLLYAYIAMFLSFKKLRKTDKTKRAYKVPGNKFVINLVTYVPMIILVTSIIFTIFVDFTLESIISNIPLIIGIVLLLIGQEIVVLNIKEETK